MNEKWIEIRRGGDYRKIGEELGVSPVLARILRNRDIETTEEMKEFLFTEEYKGHDPFSLYGMEILCNLLKRKLEEKSRIRIIGDYDVDGICATYILYKGLTFFGADVDYAIPHRVEDGYGISGDMVMNAHEAGRDTIITCDNGIAATEAVKCANSLNMTVIITDHHEVPFECSGDIKHYILPNADAIVNPKLPNCTYPFKGICGAAVALKVITAFSKIMGMENEAAYKKMILELLEFATLATICDVMELKDENRFLVKKGLKLMENSRNTGLSMLIDETGLKGKKLSNYSLGFVIGPCLNASGRLDTAKRAVDLFTEEDSEIARRLASELKNLNEERKTMTLSETKKAIEMVENMEIIPDVLVLFLPDCHESLAGIIAGKVREHFSRPCFVLTKTKEGLKGSGRSIEAYDMYEELNKVSSLLTKFGGHKLAAGISLNEENLSLFNEKLNDNSRLTEEDFRETVKIDMVLPFSYATLDLARELEYLEPLGVGNESPLFAQRDVTLLSGSIIGKNKNVAKYKVMDNGAVYEMICFEEPEKIKDYVRLIYDEKKAEMLHTSQFLDIKLNVVYKLRINEYNGYEKPQLELKYYM